MADTPPSYSSRASRCRHSLPTSVGAAPTLFLRLADPPLTWTEQTGTRPPLLHSVADDPPLSRAVQPPFPLRSDPPPLLSRSARAGHGRCHPRPEPPARSDPTRRVEVVLELRAPADRSLAVDGPPIRPPCSTVSRTDAATAGTVVAVFPAFAFREESIWPLNWRASEVIAYGSYPQRPGAVDCAYYIRTGLCRFGMTCKFNHPPNRKLAAVAAKIMGHYPERVGQPECQYYLKTGKCKYGITCKFHHPRNMLSIDGEVQLNCLGYPLRPNEAECAYYIRTGECKFGNTCKFHHPQPQASDARVSLCGSPVYSSVNSNVTSGQQTYPGGLMNWPLSRASIVPSSGWPGSSSYAHLVVPREMVQVSSWNTFTGQSGGLLSPQSPHQVWGAPQFDGTLNQSEISRGDPGIFAHQSGSVPLQYAMQMESIFPERPDQPECQFYMKTGDCKFGAVCRFHHPRERLLPAPDCVLSPLGLPLRDGKPLCVFYSRYGLCKFGPACKFDHPMATPMGILAYGLSTPSASDVPIVQRVLGSFVPPPARTSSEGPMAAVHGKSSRLSMSDSTESDSHDEEATEAEGPT